MDKEEKAGRLLIHIGKEDRYYPQGTTFAEIAADVQPDYPHKIILASENNHLAELGKVPADGCSLQFVTTGDRDGHLTYVRGATMLFLASAYTVLGHTQLKKLTIEYALGDGYYFDIDYDGKMTQAKLDRIEAHMKKLVSRNLPFKKINMRTEDVRSLFHDLGMTDKDRLFHYRTVSHTNIYKLGGFLDYYYGYMPPSSGYLTRFSLHLYRDGIVLVLPNQEAPEEPGKYSVPEKLFEIMKRTNSWGIDMGIGTVGELNDLICRGGARQTILVQEAYQERMIANIAEEIKKEERRIIMIAGPSSSGKTSFSYRLSVQLTNCGLVSHPLAIDNYFKSREETPRDENGEYDFECLEALRTDQFNDHLVRLLRGEKVEIPRFNFVSGHQESMGDYLQLGKNEVLVIEGIHGLNDALSYAVPREDKYKIYISALTQLNVDEHNRISTTDGRLIRRMVRDARTRGSSASNTISRWPSVRRGEKKHIFPYQEDADVMFNSAMPYELALLKTFAEPLLFGVEPGCPEEVEAKRLLKFLGYFLAVDSEDVPKNSIMREFIGGSVFPV